MLMNKKIINIINEKISFYEEYVDEDALFNKYTLIRVLNSIKESEEDDSFEQ